MSNLKDIQAKLGNEISSELNGVLGQPISAQEIRELNINCLNSYQNQVRSRYNTITRMDTRYNLMAYNLMSDEQVRMSEDRFNKKRIHETAEYLKALDEFQKQSAAREIRVKASA